VETYLIEYPMTNLLSTPHFRRPRQTLAQPDRQTAQKENQFALLPSSKVMVRISSKLPPNFFELTPQDSKLGPLAKTRRVFSLPKLSHYPSLKEKLGPCMMNSSMFNAQPNRAYL
jgi:hypothetical protein